MDSTSSAGLLIRGRWVTQKCSRCVFLFPGCTILPVPRPDRNRCSQIAKLRFKHGKLQQILDFGRIKFSGWLFIYFGHLSPLNNLCIQGCITSLSWSCLSALPAECYRWAPAGTGPGGPRSPSGGRHAVTRGRCCRGYAAAGGAVRCWLPQSYGSRCCGDPESRLRGKQTWRGTPQRLWMLSIFMHIFQRDSLVKSKWVRCLGFYSV